MRPRCLSAKPIVILPQPLQLGRQVLKSVYQAVTGPTQHHPHLNHSGLASICLAWERVVGALLPHSGVSCCTDRGSLNLALLAFSAPPSPPGWKGRAYLRGKLGVKTRAALWSPAFSLPSWDLLAASKQGLWPALGCTVGRCPEQEDLELSRCLMGYGTYFLFCCKPV